ncbi:MAG: hypothetical protein H7336_09955 [Bacteriovorax sp.]|nr:hypothetical protein [Bacteriovorax sp.]
MKTFTALMALAFSLSAFAGPEEHQQAQICYYVVVETSSPITNDIPSEICLERLRVDTALDTISAYSYFFPSLYLNLKLDSVTRKNEDFYSFKSSSVVRDDVDGSTTQKITLFISGQVDNYGDADLRNLTLNLEQIVGKTYVEYPYVKNTYNYKLF